MPWMLGGIPAVRPLGFGGARAVKGSVERGAGVAEPSELFRLKCANHCYTADINSMHFKRNSPLVCRISARYNHGSTGSKQVYLARR
jgi:hypothetical protein